MSTVAVSEPMRARSMPSKGATLETFTSAISTVRSGKLLRMVISHSPQSTTALRFLFTSFFTAASILSLKTMGNMMAAARTSTMSMPSESRMRLVHLAMVNADEVERQTERPGRS